MGYEQKGHQIIQIDNKGLRQEVDVVKSQLAQITNKAVVNVEDFEGVNAFEKVQNAINFAVLNGNTLEFTKMYDITGFGALSIIKEPPRMSTLFFVGKGGGIIKNDAGFIFSNPQGTPYISDFDVTGMRFISTTPSTETNVWDGDSFIRIHSYGNYYQGIDSVIKAVNIRVQSCRFDKEIIRRGNSYAFLSRIFIDVTIVDCLIENRTSGWGYSGGGIANIVSSDTIADKVNNYNLRVINNVIEELALEGVKLGTCVASEISGNYMEENGAYYDLWTLVDTGSFHASLNFSANHTQMTSAQVTALVPTLKIKNILRNNSVNIKQKGNTFFSNNRTNGILYETNSFIHSAGDYSTINKLCEPTHRLILVSGSNLMEENVDLGNKATIVSGVSYGYRVTQPVYLTANEERIMSVKITNAYFEKPITDNSVVSVTADDLSKFIILSYKWYHSSANVAYVDILVRNITAVVASSTLYINVINLGD